MKPFTVVYQPVYYIHNKTIYINSKINTYLIKTSSNVLRKVIKGRHTHYAKTERLYVFIGVAGVVDAFL